MEPESCKEKRGCFSNEIQWLLVKSLALLKDSVDSSQDLRHHARLLLLWCSGLQCRFCFFVLNIKNVPLFFGLLPETASFNTYSFGYLRACRVLVIRQSPRASINPPVSLTARNTRWAGNEIFRSLSHRGGYPIIWYSGVSKNEYQAYRKCQPQLHKMLVCILPLEIRMLPGSLLNSPSWSVVPSKSQGRGLCWSYNFTERVSHGTSSSQPRRQAHPLPIRLSDHVNMAGLNSRHPKSHFRRSSHRNTSSCSCFSNHRWQRLVHGSVHSERDAYPTIPARSSFGESSCLSADLCFAILQQREADFRAAIPRGFFWCIDWGSRRWRNWENGLSQSRSLTGVVSCPSSGFVGVIFVGILSGKVLWDSLVYPKKSGNAMGAICYGRADCAAHTKQNDKVLWDEDKSGPRLLSAMNRT